MPAVEWWYVQNILLMVRTDYLEGAPRLQQEAARDCGPRSVVHPRAYLDRLAAAERMGPRGLREWLAAGPALVGTTARRFVRRATGGREP